ncbi:hypothetical protein CYMTET_29319 [Cymbomonas tetramitiformis]|uniref:Uncharacterized protein n=1 Tax=Cymbomonas tetramitiformis TaxID=36881 RepID=A0AAE0FLB2_9CHLO|nr:hypothetical protein CYMTET_29319 [Cymbomonas tetramitiformis]
MLGRSMERTIGGALLIFALAAFYWQTQMLHLSSPKPYRLGADNLDRLLELEADLAALREARKAEKLAAESSATPSEEEPPPADHSADRDEQLSQRELHLAKRHPDHAEVRGRIALIRSSRASEFHSVAHDHHQGIAQKQTMEMRAHVSKAGEEAARRNMTAASCSWRQTTGCQPDGSREKAADLGCTAIVGPSASGFCECYDGFVKASSACGHVPLVCSNACMDCVVETPARMVRTDQSCTNVGLNNVALTKGGVQPVPWTAKIMAPMWL